jgi:hypothetical protein
MKFCGHYAISVIFSNLSSTHRYHLCFIDDYSRDEVIGQRTKVTDIASDAIDILFSE